LTVSEIGLSIECTMNDLPTSEAQIDDINGMSPGSDFARDRAALNILDEIIGPLEPSIRTQPRPVGVDPPDRHEDPERVRLYLKARAARADFMQRWACRTA
jgi:hypothetical protein